MFAVDRSDDDRFDIIWSDDDRSNDSARTGDSSTERGEHLYERPRGVKHGSGVVPAVAEAAVTR